MMKLIYIAMGAVVGSVGRYGVSEACYKFFNGSFPLGTLSVNLIGSFVIGILWGLCDSMAVSQNVKLFLFVGLLGSFTTFSAFSLENFNLLRNGDYMWALLNILGSAIVGVALVCIGFFAAQAILQEI